MFLSIYTVSIKLAKVQQIETTNNITVLPRTKGQSRSDKIYVPRIKRFYFIFKYFSHMLSQ